MKIKNIIIFSIISSLLLLSLISIWKILSTLQGVKLDNLNFQILFILGFLVTFLNVIIEKKINFLIRLFIFSFIFIFIDGYLIQNLPFWYNFGSFLIICLFFNKLKKYNNDFFINEHSTQTIIFDFLTLFGIVLFSFVILFPFYMMLVTSFKTQIALLVNPLDFSINFNQDIKELFKSYFVIFKSYKFGKYILTSTIVSLGTVLITLLFAIPAAYAIARLNFFGKSFMSTSILIIYMFPAIVLVIPLYTVFSQLGLRNSIFGLLIVYTATTLPVAIYMLQGYFKSIPKELEEAAQVDGANRWNVIRHVILPEVRPYTLVVCIMATIASLRTFGEVYVMTGGGPFHRTNLLSYYIYTLGFKYLEVGYAAAVSLLLLFIILFLSYVNFRFAGGDLNEGGK